MAHGIRRALWLLLMLAAAVRADTYQYDVFGQLRYIQRDDGSVIHFFYDAAGSLLSVMPGEPVDTFRVTGIDPDVIRRGEQGEFVISGSGLESAVVVSPGAFLAVGAMEAADEAITFELAAGTDAPLGPHDLLVNVPGFDPVPVQVTVHDAPPTLAVFPTPIAIPPDGQPYGFSLRLSRAVDDDVSATLYTLDPELQVAPEVVTIAAGSREVPFALSATAEGVYPLHVNGAGAELQFPVFVTSEYRGVYFAVAPEVGVHRAGEHSGPELSALLLAPPVGVNRGSVVDTITPHGLAVGEVHELLISGQGLDGADGLEFGPAGGLAVLSLQPAADGHSVRALVQVAGSAELGLRRANLLRAGAPYPWSRPEGGHVLISGPAPAIHALLPHYVERGGTASIRVLGENLQHATAIEVIPPTALSIAVTSIAGDGRELVLGVSALATAAQGPRVLVVHSPTGSTPTVAEPANTLWVTDRDPTVYSPLMAPQVGVIPGGAPPAPDLELTDWSPAVGVSFGAIALDRNPAAWARGGTFQFRVQGHGLGAVTAVEVLPAEGLDLGEVVIQGDGTGVELAVAVAPDAALGLRTLRLHTATGTVPFADPARERVRITDPPPEITGLKPSRVSTGTVTTLRVFGHNLDQVSRVYSIPHQDISFAGPALAGNGGEVTVSMAVDSGAVAGPRVIVLESPAGESSHVPTSANTLHVSSEALLLMEPLMAPAVGVRLGEDDDTPPAPDAVLALAPLVGVDIPVTPVPVEHEYLRVGPYVGVSRGPAVHGLTRSPLMAGASGTLDLTGVALDRLAEAVLLPLEAGVEVTAISVTADARAARLSLNIPASVEAGRYRLHLIDADGQPLPFANAALASIPVAAGAPVVESISPIVGQPGDTFTLIIRGRHLNLLEAIEFTPGQGMQLGTGAQVSADGTRIEVPLHVHEDAALGARTLRVHTAGGASEASSVPANTFTVF